MSEDTVTALFRATVVAARSEGEESAYRIAARYIAELVRDHDTLSHDAVYLRLDALRYEFEVQANAARTIAGTANRRMRRAKDDLNDM